MPFFAHLLAPPAWATSWAPVVAACFTVVLGVAGALIARQQMITAAHKLQADLFDRRYKVYQACIDLLSGSSGDQMIEAFKLRTGPARFLFQSEVFDYIAELDQWAGEKYICGLNSRAGGASPEKVEQLERVLSLEETRLYYLLPEVFAPYLTMGVRAGKGTDRKVILRRIDREAAWKALERRGRHETPDNDHPSPPLDNSPPGA